MQLYQMIVLAAVSVSPCDIAAGCATRTRGSSDFWNAPKMRSRSVLLTPPWITSTENVLRNSAATILTDETNGTNTITLPCADWIMDLVSSTRGAVGIVTSVPSVAYTTPQAICTSLAIFTASLTAVISPSSACMLSRVSISLYALFCSGVSVTTRVSYISGGKSRHSSLVKRTDGCITFLTICVASGLAIHWNCDSCFITVPLNLLK